MKPSALCALAALIPLAVYAADEPKPASKYAAEFAKHWTTARELSLAVANAMPEESYGFKPNPDEMTFGEQMVHIAQGNYGYCAFIGGGKSPFTKPEKIDKAAAVKALGDSFDYCGGILSALSDDDLNSMRGAETRRSSVREVALGAYAHMAHHRGQAEVYLRLKGIKPPQYKF